MRAVEVDYIIFFKTVKDLDKDKKKILTDFAKANGIKITQFVCEEYTVVE